MVTLIGGKNQTGNATVTNPVPTQLTDGSNEIDSSNPLPIDVISSALPSGAATESKQNDIITELEKKADITEKQPVIPYHTDGTGGINITGVEKIAGKDGIDSSTNTLQTISYAHHEIHSGSHYFYREAHSIAKNGTVDHLIVTPNTTKWAHIIIGIEAISSSITVDLYEDTVTSNNGTQQTPRNRNRNFPDNNTTLLYEAPTITSVGNMLSDSDFGAGKNSAGGKARDSEEIVLKQNTKYLLRVREDNTQATTVNITLDWYEHQDKN